MLIHQHKVVKLLNSISQFTHPLHARMCIKCCSSCHLKLILGRMMPSCLQKKELHICIPVRAEVRHPTLEEFLYPQASWETDAIESTPARRYSPKVCPLNLDFSSESISPIINESISISRTPLRSHDSTSRRVSFRSPHEYDVFIIQFCSGSDAALHRRGVELAHRGGETQHLRERGDLLRPDAGGKAGGSTTRWRGR